MMNRKHRNRFTVLLLVVCMIALLGIQPIQTAAASDENMVVVTTLDFLKTAIANASDGDVIGISGTITIYADNTVIGIPDKHVILKRTTAESKITMIQESSISLIQNITFDGCEISSEHPFITISHSPTFKNVTFRNCISTSLGGAISITGGEVNFDSCTFENNKSLNGGHIALMPQVDSNAIANINNSIFIGGYATEKGGAIYTGKPGSSCNIDSSTITENEAGDFGGVMLARGFKKVKLNKETIEAYEVITEEHQKSAASGVARGIVGGALLGGVGMLAGALSAKEKGIYQVAIQFKDGKKSLLKIEDAIYKRLVQDLF